jgi:NAD(P)-dependent dehydrogenase (short-subunit alcohol dehydrogenase family)
LSYLNGKTAIVTGAASGIGESTARELARNGVKVLIADIKDGTPVASEIDGIFLEADVTEADQVKGAVDRVVDEWGRLDVMVNNAGIEVNAWLAETDEADHRRVIDINLNGVFYGIK